MYIWVCLLILPSAYFSRKTEFRRINVKIRHVASPNYWLNLCQRGWRCRLTVHCESEDYLLLMTIAARKSGVVYDDSHHHDSSQLVKQATIFTSSVTWPLDFSTCLSLQYESCHFNFLQAVHKINEWRKVIFHPVI